MSGFWGGFALAWAVMLLAIILWCVYLAVSDYRDVLRARRALAWSRAQAARDHACAQVVADAIREERLEALDSYATQRLFNLEAEEQES